MRNPPPNLLNHRLATLGDRYSDMTLICESEAFEVHRLLLHLRSTLPIPKHRLLVIDNHPLRAVKAIIDYIYTSTYNLPRDCTDPLTFHIEPISIGREYCTDLSKEAFIRFKTALQEGTWAWNDWVRAAGTVEIHEGGLLLRRTMIEAMSSRFEEFKHHGACLRFWQENPSWHPQTFAAEEVRRKRIDEKLALMQCSVA